MKPPTIQMLTVLTLAVFEVQGYSSCQDYFDSSDSCPEINYEEINELCCGDNDTLKLHCISTHTGNPHEYSQVFHACLEPQVIPAGNGMSFKPRHSPQEIQLVPCTGRFYEPDDRNSTDVHHDYCSSTYKTRCYSTGETLVCHGGPTQDDLCGCAQGFKPWNKNCSKGFDQNDHCQCVEHQCPPGKARNTSGMFQGDCPANRSVPLSYTCYPIPSPTPTTTASPTPTRGSSSPQPTTPAPSEAEDGDDLRWLGFLILIPVVIIIIFRFRKKVLKWATVFISHFRCTFNKGEYDVVKQSSSPIPDVHLTRVNMNH